MPKIKWLALTIDAVILIESIILGVFFANYGNEYIIFCMLFFSIYFCLGNRLFLSLILKMLSGMVIGFLYASLYAYISCEYSNMPSCHFAIF